MAIVALWPPEVPVTVSVFVPIGAELLAVSVRIVYVDAGFGFQSTETPLGRPDTEKVMLLLNPYCGLT
jgi:hypothetical protein